MPLDSIQHSAILASAGSGKTYALTNRFIYLLHQFEQPERIIALTFTRTAAGEFFRKIVEKLCHAAEDMAYAEALSNELSIDADCDRYKHLLKLLVQNMHRLNLQTLDSFFFKIVSVFSLELGLSGELVLLNEIRAAHAHREARNHIVHRPDSAGHSFNEFWHAFKQATYGSDARSIEKIVSQYTDHLYEHYLNIPEATYWGQAETIWPHGCPWQTDLSTDWSQLANALIAALPDDLTKAQRSDFHSAAEHIRNYGSSEQLNTLLSNALAAASDIFAGWAVIKVRKEIELSKPLCQALANCLKAVVQHHLQRALNNTQGVYRILRAYQKQYDRTYRNNSQLTFTDLTHLLNPESKGSPMRIPDSTTRQLIDFRLDGSFDHWLFDEFQDTSRPQWQVVANLIDEVIQDSSGKRSFFYVGDTKQCLYLWRNSDDRLFHDIQSHYNVDEDKRIIQRPLSTSWRSAPPVIDAVNTVFGNLNAIRETFSADAASRWTRSWQTHRTSPATQNLSGFACWLEAQKDKGPTRNELILQLLNELNPIERTMSIGILVRKNADAHEITHYLREQCPLPIHNGSAIKPTVDNAAGVALLQMLQLAAHPGDTLARSYLQLIDLSTEGPSLVESTVALRAHLFSESAESAVRWASEQIEAHLPENDDWHRERLQQVVDQARAFDGEPDRSIDNLIQFLKAGSISSSKLENAVIIETIHKSKGLEYDTVIYVNEDKHSRTETDITPLQDNQGNTQWLLQPMRKELMQADPSLKQLLDQTTSQRDFGNLCTLYVAMTRAKRGLYMISDLKGAHRTSTVHFLKQILGSESQKEPQLPYPVLWSTGDPNWHKTFQPPAAERVPPITAETRAFQPAHPRLQLARPSTLNSPKISAAKCFELEQKATHFGTRVHQAFEAIEWFTELPQGLEENVQKTLQNCFDQPDIRALFSRPAGQSIVWRERAFSHIEDDWLINGVFDRVVIRQDENGAITDAEIIDFKTDRIHPGNTLEQATKHHRTQMEAYRKALAKIVRINEGSIKLILVFTNIPQRVQL